MWRFLRIKFISTNLSHSATWIAWWVSGRTLGMQLVLISVMTRGSRCEYKPLVFILYIIRKENNKPHYELERWYGSLVVRHAKS